MDFKLTEEQHMVIDGAKKFAEKELAPVVAETGREAGGATSPPSRSSANWAILGMTVPEEYGGTGLGAVAYAGAMIEFSKVDAGTAVARIGPELPGQRRGHDVRDRGAEEGLSAQADFGGMARLFLADRGRAPGSDPGALRATAVRDGDHFVLNGTKNFTTNGGFADVIIAFFQTDKDKGAKGISAFLRREGHARLRRGQAREQAGHPLLEHDRDGLHRLPGPGREPARARRTRA